MNNRYFIDKGKQVRECGNCRKVLPFSSFSPTGKKEKGMVHSYCKKCRAFMNAQAIQEKKLVNMPSTYVQCDNDFCNHIWMKKHRDNCSKCGDTYSEQGM